MIDTGGGGVPLVLIHGLANSVEIWDRVMPRLARRSRVVAFDLPGFGQADRPVAAYDGAFFAAQVLALLDTLGIARAHLVGSSLGASVVLHVSGVTPDRIERAVLAAPGGFGRATHPLMRLPALPLIGPVLGRPTPRNNALTLKLAIHDPARITPELRALTDLYADMPGSDLSFVRTLRSGVGLCGSRDTEGVARLARAFDRPALVLWGRQDRVFPPKHSDRAMELLPRASRVLIDDCGHYPHWEQPDAFAGAVEDFLA